MKKLFFIIFITIASFISAADIKLSSNTTKQGGFVYAQYPANKTYEFQFKNSLIKIKSFVYGDKKYAFIPVHYSTPVGSYTLTVAENGSTVFSAPIKIVDGNFKKSYIKVTKKMETKRSEKNLKAGADKISEAKKIQSDKLWHGKFMMPIPGKENSTTFGAMRFVNGKVVGYHSGIDFPVGIGTPIKAANDGKVIFASMLTTTGNTLVIDHGMNVYSSYCHLSAFNVKVGQKVKKGQIIGKTGNTGFTTGPHLHFTMAIGTTFVDPRLFMKTPVIE